MVMTRRMWPQQSASHHTGTGQPTNLSCHGAEPQNVGLDNHFKLSQDKRNKSEYSLNFLKNILMFIFTFPTPPYSASAVSTKCTGSLPPWRAVTREERSVITINKHCLHHPPAVLSRHYTLFRFIRYLSMLFISNR